VETKPAPLPAWRADPTALLVDPLDPDFAEPRPPPTDTSPQLSADELRRAGIGTLSTSATSALSALALAGERATDAAKGLRTAFANSKLASTKLARSADDDEDDDDDDDDAVDADGFTSKTLQNERTLHACFNEAMRRRLEGASAKAVSRPIDAHSCGAVDKTNEPAPRVLRRVGAFGHRGWIRQAPRGVRSALRRHAE
jgi:hypothetical protein